MARKELEKTYSPKEVEERWSKEWLDGELFKADPDSGKPTFSMVIPPPNITGALHVGHALNNTLQDILARYKRMDGYSVLWVPGIDHAGIATQNVVEKQLAAEGLDRHQLGREEFINRVWRWKSESGGTIQKQLKRLGASCDWSRERFTMDEGLSKSVREVFVRLYDEGLIYRGDYIVNWCPRCHTAISDLEVESEETGGKLYHMRYPVKGHEGRELTVATTRPETMLGDTAVAVNPEDERYKDLIGEFVLLPLTGREIPIIADGYVDMEFGTGAVKITPAHDFNDFEMAKRHGLESINIMDIEANMNAAAGPHFEGMDRYTARKAVLKALDDEGLLAGTDEHKMFLGACYRCSTVVEPRLSKQWFVKVESLAKPALEAVEDGTTRFVPKNWERTYFEWMNNIRDWCISRQIWWGHRIPAWHCEDCGHVTVSKVDVTECESCGSKLIEQETDVLDTWFSSALWPFSTLGWPEDKGEVRAYYPTSVLSTSFDIIFFWVARMMMMGIKFMGEVPFNEIYIHALVRDSDGRKMSKSKGNVIDPLLMMDRFGTDATRFTLAILAAQGRDIKISEERIEGYRNFCNKLWNLTRFTLMNLEGEGGELQSTDRVPEEGELSTADRWIINRLNLCTEGVRRGIDTYKFDEAGKALYRFFWHELCDWYVELSKADLRGDNGEERREATLHTLVMVLREGLKLIHPFMPFISEELNTYLPGEEGERSLTFAEYPKVKDLGREYGDDDRGMEIIMDTVRAIRNVRTEMNIAPKKALECICTSGSDEVRGLFTRCEGYLKLLVNVGTLTVRDSGNGAVPAVTPDDAVLAIASGDYEVHIPLKGAIDVEGEVGRIKGELQKVESEIKRVEGKLGNDSFTSKAPSAVIEKERGKLAGFKDTHSTLIENLERMKGLLG